MITADLQPGVRCIFRSVHSAFRHLTGETVTIVRVRREDGPRSLVLVDTGQVLFPAYPSELEVLQ